MIGAPFEAGAVQLTRAEALPVAALPAAGALGTVRGVAAADCVDAGLVPQGLVEVPVNV